MPDGGIFMRISCRDPEAVAAALYDPWIASSLALLAMTEAAEPEEAATPFAASRSARSPARA